MRVNKEVALVRDEIRTHDRLKLDVHSSVTLEVQRTRVKNFVSLTKATFRFTHVNRDSIDSIETYCCKPRSLH